MSQIQGTYVFYPLEDGFKEGLGNEMRNFIFELEVGQAVNFRICCGTPGSLWTVTQKCNARQTYKSATRPAKNNVLYTIKVGVGLEYIGSSRLEFPKMLQ